MKIIIATLKSWNIENAKKFAGLHGNEHIIDTITNNEDFEAYDFNGFNPDYIFFPHWSYIIPEAIYSSYNCVVFHMTDLPYGRGGSPLQNLIVRGHKETKISAIKVVKELDAGPVYMKSDLGLNGTAEEIYKRASSVIFSEMMPRFLNEEMIATKQQGKIVTFKRRTPDESKLKPDMTLEQLYDYIRMLDAEGYPNAYIDFGDWKLLFNDARLEEGSLEAKVRFSNNISND